MGYLAPSNDSIPSDWADHKYRNPPSAEPGTDYATPYGTNLIIAGNGVVSVVDTSTGGGEGRRLSIDLDDGRKISYLHLSAIFAHVGLRVSRGQQNIIYSGASGNGSDWYYGAHVHVSLWERPGMAYKDTIDFELYVGDSDPKPPVNNPEGEAIMYIRALSNGQYAKMDYIYANDIEGHWRGVSNLEGEGYIKPLARTQLPYAEFDGIDLDLLFAVNGLWEQNTLDGSVKWSSGEPLVGLGALTGRLIYPGSEGKIGQYHNPNRTVPVWVIVAIAALIGVSDVVTIFGLLR